VTRSDVRRMMPVIAVVYAVAVSSIGAALVTRNFAFRTSPSFARLLLWQAPVYGLWGCLVLLIAAVTRARRVLRQLIAGMLAAPFVIVAASALIVGWVALAHPDGAAHRVVKSFGQRFNERLPIDVLMFFFVLAAVLAYRGFVRAAEEERELALARLDALKAQLRPHFLFNTLHTIGALIETDAEAARAMLGELSELLRLTLARGESQWTTVEEELEAVHRYLGIVGVRFGDRLRYEVRVDPDVASARLPDFLLQPLLENAVAHGIAPLARGGTIALDIRRHSHWLCVRLSDDGVGLADEWSEGIGLSATRRRMEMLFGSHASLSIARGSERGTVVTIVLPMEGER
jgi:two-component system, LytTR family, sensor kinase